MQTFLPHDSFHASAQVLDRQRLGKQRVECLQILNAIIYPTTKGWVNHPCTKMWRATPSALLSYTVIVCQEWTRRGYKDTVKQKVLDLAVENPHVFTDLECIQTVRNTQEVIGPDGHVTGIFALDIITEVHTSIWPWWMGDQEFHRTHQSNLVRKDPTYYRPFFPDVPDSLPYIWPQEGGTFSS